MKRRLLVALVACLFALSAHAAVKVKPWSPLFTGVDQTTATIDGPHASVIYAVRIDLKAPGIHFLASPHSGSKETISETTRQFATEHHLQVAINAGFFTPCCNVDPREEDILGLTVAEGKVIAPPSSDGTYNEALMITRDNDATIGVVSPGADLSRVYTAVTGSAMIVKNGVNNGSENTLNKAPYGNPRTVVGLSRDRRYLYWVVIDGRKPGYSFGTTNTESADILLALGAYTGLNLDGGGSTTLVRQNAQGKVVTVNRPSSGTDRLVASSLGVYAEPLPR